MTRVYTQDPAFYEFRFKGIKDRNESIDSKILALFSEFGSFQQRFIAFHTTIKNTIQKGLKQLHSMFPEFEIDIPIHICHSLGECDGATRFLDNQDVLVLGIDVMAQVHTWDNEIPFIQHELFHIYHLRLYPHVTESFYHEDTIARGLWIEGLAVYISYLLNPQATKAELLLDTPPQLIEETKKRTTIAPRSLPRRPRK